MGKLKENIVYNFLYQILVIFLPFVTAPYLSRTIGAQGIGIYTFSYSIALYFTYFVLLGLNKYGNRSIATVQDDKNMRSKVFSELYYMQLVIGVIVFIVYLFYCFFIAENKYAAFIQMIFVLSSLLDVNWLFFGMEKFKLTVKRNVIVKICSVILIFVFVRDVDDIYNYIFIMAISQLASQVILHSFLRKYISFKCVKCREIFKHIKPNLVLFVPVIAVSVYRIMDKIMLGYMCQMKDVGFYENAEKIINVPIALVTSIGTVMLPRMTRIISDGNDGKEETYMNKTMLFIIAFANAATFGIISIAKDFSVFFYGSEFIQSGKIMQVLSLTIVFLSIGNVIRTQYLIPHKLDNIYIKSAIAGAVINLVLNVILIPEYKAIGAAIATVITEIIVCGYQLCSVRQYIDYKKYLKWELSFGTISIIMYIIICLLPNIETVVVNIIKDVIVGILVYGVLSIIYIKKQLKNSKEEIL